MADHAGDLEDLLYGQGLAERTVREYAKWCRRLARWCALHGLELATLEAHQVRRWIDQTVPPGRESRKQAYTACKHLYTMLGRGRPAVGGDPGARQTARRPRPAPTVTGPAAA